MGFFKSPQEMVACPDIIFSYSPRRFDYFNARISAGAVYLRHLLVQA